jgi:hypothetical protein
MFSLCNWPHHGQLYLVESDMSLMLPQVHAAEHTNHHIFTSLEQEPIKNDKLEVEL